MGELWRAHLVDTRIWSRLWHSLQMVSTSSQVWMIGKFICGTPWQGRQKLLDRLISLTNPR